VRASFRTALALAVLLAGCGGGTGGYYKGDGPGGPPPVNLDKVADATPRVEPLNRGANDPYTVLGRKYVPYRSLAPYRARGIATWYGRKFHGKSTASGERYDMYAMTAAHKTLPIPCYAEVTNLRNGRKVVVRINDRGPFVANRILDLSYTAAQRLDIVRTGTAFVELQTVQPGDMPAPAAPVPPAPVVPAPLPAAPAPEPAPAEVPVAPAVAPPLVALYIQVGAFADPGNAQRLVERLRAAGIRQVFTLDSAATGPLLRRVRVGPVTRVEDFDRLAARLASLGYPEARLAND